MYRKKLDKMKIHNEEDGFYLRPEVKQYRKEPDK